MDKIVSLNNKQISLSLKKEVLKKGEKILEENNFFNKLDNIMRNENFRSFYSEYFHDYTDIKTVILYMKLYETIEKEYKERYNLTIEKELLAYMMKELMSNSLSRKNILESFNNFTDYNNNVNKKYILDIFNNDPNIILNE